MNCSRKINDDTTNIIINNIKPIIIHRYSIKVVYIIQLKKQHKNIIRSVILRIVYITKNKVKKMKENSICFQ